MKNWPIAKRIITGGATLLVLLLLVGAVGVTSLSKIGNIAKTRLQQDALPGIINISLIGERALRSHIRILMLRDAPDATERDKYLALIATNTAAVTTALQSYEAALFNEEDKRNIEELKQKRAAYEAARQEYINLAKASRHDEARAYFAQQVDPTFDAYKESISKVLKWNENSANTVTSEIVETTQRTILLSSSIAGAALLIALAFGWVIIRSVNRALKEMAQTLDDASSQIAAASGQVSASSQTLAEGSSEQAASLEETSSSLEELSSMTKRNADSAVSAKALSAETRQAAEGGNNDMGEMRRAMDAIKTSSNDISKIIKTIDEIAFQTNILALNAAVEAARAGEAGAGFAVVAEEVRALAQRSANSAKETAAKIEVAIHSGDEGVAISEKVARSLGVIVEKARRVDEIVAEIATASNEQNQGIGQINTAVSQMDKVTQSNAGSAEETAAAAEELNAQSVALKETVNELQRLVGGTSDGLEKIKPARAGGGTPKTHLPSTGKTIRANTPAHRPSHETVTANGKHDDFFKDA